MILSLNCALAILSIELVYSSEHLWELSPYCSVSRASSQSGEHSVWRYGMKMICLES